MNSLKLMIVGFAAASLGIGTVFGADSHALTSWELGASKETRPERWRGVTKKKESKTNYFLPTGFEFDAITRNKIWSFNTTGPAIAAVDSNVEYLGRIVIPAHTRVIGTISIEKSHDRVLIDWHTLVFPTGDEIHFSGTALAADGSIGIPGKVETYAKDAAIASTVLKSVITGTQAVLQATETNPIASQATGALSQEAISEVDQHQQQQATMSISVDDYTHLRVYVNQRLEF